MTPQDSSRGRPRDDDATRGGLRLGLFTGERRVKKPLIALLVLMATIALACGPSGPNAEGSDGDHSGQSMDSKGDVAGKPAGEVPGTSAQPSEAETRVTVVALDDLRFDPQQIEVEAGEVVTFVVQNKGKAEHEFVLGDADYQEQHEGDMQDGHEMSRVRNAVTARPGETVELTWRFDEPGEVLFGCHEPGHYDGGMVGQITVS